MNGLRVLGLVASIGLASHCANAGGKIYQYDVGGTVIPIGGVNWIPFTSPTNLTANTNDLPVTLQTATRYVDIIPDSASDNIPLLTFSGGPTADWVKIYLGAEGSASTFEFDSEDHVPSTSGANLRGRVPAVARRLGRETAGEPPRAVLPLSAAEARSCNTGSQPVLLLRGVRGFQPRA